MVNNIGYYPGKKWGGAGVLSSNAGLGVPTGCSRGNKTALKLRPF